MSFPLPAWIAALTRDVDLRKNNNNNVNNNNNNNNFNNIDDDEEEVVMLWGTNPGPLSKSTKLSIVEEDLVFKQLQDRIKPAEKRNLIGRRRKRSRANEDADEDDEDDEESEADEYDKEKNQKPQKQNDGLEDLVKLFEAEEEKRALPLKQTPRTKFSALQAKRLKNRVDVMMRLGSAALAKEGIRMEFMRLDEMGGVDMADFAVICRQYLPAEIREEAIEPLCEIFREVDVNGDGTMSWAEFTSYLVELANNYYSTQKNFNRESPEFILTDLKDRNAHEYPISVCKFFDSLDHLIAIERGSRRFKVLDRQLKLKSVVRGHRGQILSVEHIPEQKLLASSGTDQCIRFWDASNPEDVREVSEWRLDSTPLQLCWAERSLYTSHTSGALQAWNMERCSSKGLLLGHTDIAVDIVPVSHSKGLASASLDTTVRLWDCSRGEQVQIWRGHTKGALALDYSYDHAGITSIGLDTFALGWNQSQLKPIFRINCPNPQTHFIGVRSLPRTNEIVFGDTQGGVHIFDRRNYLCSQYLPLAQLTEADCPERKEGWINCMAVSRNTEEIFCGGDKIYALGKFSDDLLPKADNQTVQYAQFNIVSMTFVTASHRSITIWDALTGQMDRRYENISDSPITAVSLDDRKRRIIIGNHTGQISVFNYSNGSLMKRLDAHESEVTGIAYLGSTQEIVTCSWDLSVVCHTDSISAKSSLLRRAREHSKDVTCLAVSPAHHLIASGSLDCTVCLYEWSVGPVVVSLEDHPAPISCMLFLGDAPLLVVGDQEGNMFLWNVKGDIGTLCELQDYNNGQPSMITGLAFDAQQQMLWSSDDDGYIKCWDLQSFVRKQFTQRSALPGGVKSRKLSLWSTLITSHPESFKGRRSGKCEPLNENSPNLITKPLLEFRAHNEKINGIQLICGSTVIGTTVLSYCVDGTVSIWDAATGKCLGALNQTFSKRKNNFPSLWDFKLDLDKRKEIHDETVFAATDEVQFREQDYARFPQLDPSAQKNAIAESSAKTLVHRKESKKKLLPSSRSPTLRFFMSRPVVFEDREKLKRQQTRLSLLPKIKRAQQSTKSLLSTSRTSRQSHADDSEKPTVDLAQERTEEENERVQSWKEDFDKKKETLKQMKELALLTKEKQDNRKKKKRHESMQLRIREAHKYEKGSMYKPPPLFKISIDKELNGSKSVPVLIVRGGAGQGELNFSQSQAKAAQTLQHRLQSTEAIRRRGYRQKILSEFSKEVM